MKPLRLTIAGLNSFREKQDIDFSRLTELGMFGIFGPTGSGKSSILDAVTLALYGNVERAGHHTQGILNQAEKKLEITFEFDIGSASNRKRYRVERVYKRGTGEYSVQHQSSRLLQLEDTGEADYGLVMIAENQREVNQAVLDIIGLQQDDFTKAVVLPQGKFAEFLQLTGKTRNEMMERLFGLEKFGQSLLSRANRQAKETVAKRDTIESAQKELGDASEAAVHDAEIAVKARKQALDAADKNLRTAQDRLKDLEQIHDLMTQFDTANTELTRLNERAEEIEGIRQSLGRHDEAVSLWPMVQTWQSAKAAVDQVKRDVESARAAEQEAKQKLDAAIAERDEAQKQAAELEPQLNEQKVLLQQAKAIESDLKQSTADLHNTRLEYGAAVKQNQEATARRDETKAEAGALEEKIGIAEKEAAEHTISPRRRESLSYLNTARQTWVSARKQEAEARAKLTGRQQQLDKVQVEVKQQAAEEKAVRSQHHTLTAAVEHLDKNRPSFTMEALQGFQQWRSQVGQHMQGLGTVDGEVAQVRRQIAAAEQTVQEETENVRKLTQSCEDSKEHLNQLRSEYEKYLENNEAEWIRRLQHQLQAGEPCPVCGATDHTDSSSGSHVNAAEDIASPSQLTAAEGAEEVHIEAQAKAQVETQAEVGIDAQVEAQVEAQVKVEAKGEVAWSNDQADALQRAEAEYSRKNDELRKAEITLAQARATLEFRKEDLSNKEKEVEETLKRLSGTWNADIESMMSTKVVQSAESVTPDDAEMSGRGVVDAQRSWSKPASKEEWATFLQQFDESLSALQKQHQAWEQQKADGEDRAAKLKEQLQTVQHQLALAQAQAQSAETEVTAQQKELAAATEETTKTAAELFAVMRQLEIELDTQGNLENNPGAQASAISALVQAELREAAEHDKLANEARQSVQHLSPRRDELRSKLSGLEEEVQQTDKAVVQKQSKMEALDHSVRTQTEQLNGYTGGLSVADAMAKVEQRLQELKTAIDRVQQFAQSAQDNYAATNQAVVKTQAASEEKQGTLNQYQQQLTDALAGSKFASVEAVRDALLDDTEVGERTKTVKTYDKSVEEYKTRCADLEKKLDGRSVDAETMERSKQEKQMAETEYRECLEAHGAAKESHKALLDRKARWQELEQERLEVDGLARRLDVITKVLRGNAFVRYVAKEQMELVARQASERLGHLTHGRYALTFNEDGDFLMRDDHNGGQTRPVNTLSGGETFLTSLSLALALSSHIQLRGQHPLEFFFLDEGFGTLDPDLLDVVISSLEALNLDRMSIGLISHVPELRQRMQRRLIVEPALPAGRGTVVRMEMA